MLFKKIILVTSIALGLCGCGFQPMLKSKTQEKQPFTLKVTGDGYATYVFRREMEKQLALVPRLSDDTYKVEVNLVGTEEAASYAQNATITRVNLDISARYRIFTANKEPVVQSSTITTSYPVIPRDEFISRSAHMTIKTRTMATLAQEVALEIARDIKQDLEKQPKL